MAAISEDTCPICLESMETIFITTCNHKFHTKCLDIHIKNSTNAKCPLCNGVLYDDSESEPNTPEPNTPEPNTPEPAESDESDDHWTELLALLEITESLTSLMITKVNIITYTTDVHIKQLLTISAQNENEALIWYFTKIRAELARIETVDMLEQYLAIDYITRTWPNPNLDVYKLNAVKEVLSSLGRRSLLTNELFIYASLFR